ADDDERLTGGIERERRTAVRKARFVDGTGGQTECALVHQIARVNERSFAGRRRGWRWKVHRLRRREQRSRRFGDEARVPELHGRERRRADERRNRQHRGFPPHLTELRREHRSAGDRARSSPGELCGATGKTRRRRRDVRNGTARRRQKSSFWLSAFGYQLSAISYQLSAISYQLSAISYQLSAISYFRGIVESCHENSEKHENTFNTF